MWRITDCQARNPQKPAAQQPRPGPAALAQLAHWPAGGLEGPQRRKASHPPASHCQACAPSARGQARARAAASGHCRRHSKRPGSTTRMCTRGIGRSMSPARFLLMPRRPATFFCMPQVSPTPLDSCAIAANTNHCCCLSELFILLLVLHNQ